MEKITARNVIFHASIWTFLLSLCTLIPAYDGSTALPLNVIYFLLAVSGLAYVLTVFNPFKRR